MRASESRFRILPGLPGTGPEPIEFNARGERTCREGFVVEFNPDTPDAWVGNFVHDRVTQFSDVCTHPNGDTIVVIARGEGFRIDPARRELVELLSCSIEALVDVPSMHLLLFQSPCEIECHGPDGRRWVSNRISWDGMRGLTVRGETLFGEAYDPTGGKVEWVPFELNLRDGTHIGGSYAR